MRVTLFHVCVCVCVCVSVSRRDMLSTVWEFIPQMIFLNSIFGYLCILIITKWCSTGATEQYADLYHVMIYMFLSPGSMDVQGQLFNGQGTLQVRVVQCSVGNCKLKHTLVLVGAAEGATHLRIAVCSGVLPAV